MAGTILNTLHVLNDTTAFMVGTIINPHFTDKKIDPD